MGVGDRRSSRVIFFGYIRCDVIRERMAYDSQRQEVRKGVYVDARAVRPLLANANFLSRKGYLLLRPSNFHLCPIFRIET